METCNKHEGLVEKIAQLTLDMNTVKNDIRDLYHISNSYVDRQARIEVKLDTVTTGLIDMAKKIDFVFQDLNKKIGDLTMLPATRWNTLVTSGITAIVLGVIGFALGKFLK